MDANTPTRIDDLYRLTLVDGLVTKAGAQEVRYLRVLLRETNTNDEREATRLAERVVMVGGRPQLLVSDNEYRLALNMKHVARLEADGTQALDGALLDLDLFARLSPHDIGLIEQRIFLLTLAAQVRYGLISQADFDKIMAGGGDQKPVAPQPLGQAAGAGAAAAAPQPGPALLHDFAGNRAGVAPGGDAG